MVTADISLDRRYFISSRQVKSSSIFENTYEIGLMIFFSRRFHYYYILNAALISLMKPLILAPRISRNALLMGMRRMIIFSRFHLQLPPVKCGFRLSQESNMPPAPRCRDRAAARAREMKNISYTFPSMTGTRFAVSVARSATFGSAAAK